MCPHFESLRMLHFCPKNETVLFSQIDQDKCNTYKVAGGSITQFAVMHKLNESQTIQQVGAAGQKMRRAHCTHSLLNGNNWKKAGNRETTSLVLSRDSTHIFLNGLNNFVLINQGQCALYVMFSSRINIFFHSLSYWRRDPAEFEEVLFLGQDLDLFS